MKAINNYRMQNIFRLWSYFNGGYFNGGSWVGGLMTTESVVSRWFGKVLEKLLFLGITKC